MNEALKNLANSIYMIPHSNNNGADELQCPCCLNRMKVQGYAGLELAKDSYQFPHAADCLLDATLKAIEAEEAAAA